MGPNRPGRGSHVGTGSFMVVSAARRRGVGRALGEYETNTVAVRLWASLGFQVVGTLPEAFASRDHGLVGLHVMHLSL